MVVKELLSLPPWVYYQGITFVFELFNNGGNELRFCYRVDTVEDGSPHKAQYDADGTWNNVFRNPAEPTPERWLYLQEGLETDADVIWAARNCWLKLWEWGFGSQMPGDSD